MEILKRTLERYQDAVLWVWLEIFLSIKEYQLFHTALSPVIFFQLNILDLKGTAKATTEDLLRLYAQRGAKTAFLTPNR